MTARRPMTWRPVRRPLSLCLRHGWAWGRRCLISPRGSIFALRATPGGWVARRRRDFQLEPET